MRTAAERKRDQRQRELQALQALPTNQSADHRRFQELIDEATQLAERINRKARITAPKVRISFPAIYAEK